MPVMQVTIHELNALLAPGSIENQSVEDFDESLTLRAVVQERLNIRSEDDVFGNFLDTIPEGISHALKAITRSAINRRHPVTLAWMPGYEWELSITDAADAASRGGITILIRSRYPSDPSPVTSGSSTS